MSQRKRKRIEEPFGWGKTIGGLARPMLRGVEKLGFTFTLMMADYNRSPSMSGNRISKLSERINNIQLRQLSRSQKPDTVAKSRVSAAC